MPPRDRLPDLRLRSGVQAGPGGVEGEAPPHPPHIAALLQQVESIRRWVREVERDTRRARTLLADPAFHTDTKLQSALDGVVTSSGAAGLKVCGALRQLAAGGDAPGAGGKIARTQAACWRRAYSAALEEQHALLAAARDLRLQLLRQHAHIVNIAITDEECESLLEADSIALFVDNVRAETAQARLCLREAEARHAELVRVEASLREVRALFGQLAALVSAQQDALDTVQHFALQASDRVGGGQQHLLKGNVVRRKAQQKKYGIIICMVSGLILVLMVLILT